MGPSVGDARAVDGYARGVCISGARAAARSESSRGRLSRRPSSSIRPPIRLREDGSMSGLYKVSEDVWEIRVDEDVIGCVRSIDNGVWLAQSADGAIQIRDTNLPEAAQLLAVLSGAAPVPDHDPYGDPISPRQWRRLRGIGPRTGRATSEGWRPHTERSGFCGNGHPAMRADRFCWHCGGSVPNATASREDEQQVGH